jgi:hypothetical protein
MADMERRGGPVGPRSSRSSSSAARAVVAYATAAGRARAVGGRRASGAWTEKPAWVGRLLRHMDAGAACTAWALVAVSFALVVDGIVLGPARRRALAWKR